MSRYYLLVVFLLAVIIATLHFFGMNRSAQKAEAVQSTDRTVQVTIDPSSYKYERYELFRSKDRLFHFSYPSSWFVVDTTIDMAKKSDDIFQTWSLSDFPETWNIKADFSLKSTSNNFQKLVNNICKNKKVPCQKKTINGIVYNRTVETTTNNTKLFSYEALNGSRIITIIVTVKDENQQTNIAEWDKIDDTFRFFQ